MPRIDEATINRDQFRRQWRPAQELGLPEAELTTAIDVHQSQIGEPSFLATGPLAFAVAFGTE